MFLVVKEGIQSGQLSVEHISTNFLIVDPLTKGLLLKMFHEHTARMGIMSLKEFSFSGSFVILYTLII